MTERALNEHPFGNPDGGDAPTITQPSIVDTVLDLDALLSADVRRAESVVRICTRPELYGRIDELEDELDPLVDRTGKPLGDGSLADGTAGRATDLANQIEQAQADIAASMRTIRLQQLVDEEWLEFKATWDEALKGTQADRVPMNNALIAACAVAPKMTSDQVAAMRKKLGSPVLDDLGLRAWNLNTRVGVSVPKSQLSSAVLRQQGPAKS